MTVLLVAMPTPPPPHSTPAPVSAMLLVNHMLHKVQDHVSAFFCCHLPSVAQIVMAVNYRFENLLYVRKLFLKMFPFTKSTHQNVLPGFMQHSQ